MPKKPRFILGGSTKYIIKTSAAFDRELVKVFKRGKNIRKLEKVVNMLANGKKLPAKYRDHVLKDNKNFQQCRECHIEPDWLLVYKIRNEELTLTLTRTGSHADLFKK